MRLLTWNLSDLDVTAPGMLSDARVDYLVDSKPDVLCLQKLNGEVVPEQLDEGLSKLAGRLGMSGALSRAAGQRLNVAVLWREPFRLRQVVAKRAAGARRNYLVMDLESHGRRLRVGSVHLPSTSGADRLHDLDLICPLVDPVTVLAGDWNSTGADASYDVRRLHDDERRVGTWLDLAGLMDSALVAGAPWEPTWGTLDEPPFVRIDAVRICRDLARGVRRYRVHTGADGLSLHPPVEVTLEFC